MSGLLEGRVAIVTGAGRGIGRAHALELAAHGAAVVVNDHGVSLSGQRSGEGAGESPADEVVAAIEAAGGRVAAYACDLTDTADGGAVDLLVTRVLDEHGTVDYLVNNAGRSIRRSLSLSYDRFHDVERSTAINFLGPVRLTLGLLPAMRAQKFGHVVNVVTWGVQMKAPKYTAYIASKTALDVWSRVAGRETYGDNVTFTNMRFALVRTAMSAPTEAYANLPGLRPEQAAAKVVRALEDRPLTTGTVPGRLGEWFNLVAPRLSDAAFHRLDRRVPDSWAARRSASDPGPPR